MSSTEATRKGSASPPGEGAAEDKGGGNLLPEVQFGRGEVRVRGKFRVMDWGRGRVTDRVELGGWAGSRSGSGLRSESGSWIEAGKGGASPGGLQQAGWVQSIPQPA